MVPVSTLLTPQRRDGAATRSDADVSQMDDVKITFENMRYDKRAGESVLDALLRGGANVPFSCRRGSCHVCVLQATEGEPDTDSRGGLRQEMVDAGLFKACIAKACGTLTVQRPDTTQWVSGALVHGKTQVSPTVYRLLLETSLDITWSAGQFVHIKGPHEEWRTYSIASLRRQDYFLELHVKHWPGGKVSDWVASELAAGMMVQFRGPFGACTYETTFSGRPLLLIATGTGIAPLSGVARTAIEAGHQGAVQLYHGARSPAELYMRDELSALADKHENLTFTACASEPALAAESLPRGVLPGRALDRALGEHPELGEYEVFLCGNPAAVNAARASALARGAKSTRIHADAFESPAVQPPTDQEVPTRIQPDPSRGKRSDKA